MFTSFNIFVTGGGGFLAPYECKTYKLMDTWVDTIIMIMMMRSWPWPWWWWWRDHDHDDDDDDDDCKCGATSGLDGTCFNRRMRIEESQTHQAQTWTQTWSNMNQRTSLLSCGCLFPEAKAWPWCTYQRWALESKPAQCRTREGCSRLSPIPVHRIPMVL